MPDERACGAAFDQHRRFFPSGQYRLIENTNPILAPRSRPILLDYPAVFRMRASHWMRSSQITPRPSFSSKHRNRCRRVKDHYAHGGLGDAVHFSFGPYKIGVARRRQPGRYRVIPIAGERHLQSRKTEDLPSNYLFDELQQRLQNSLVEFRLIVQLTADGDPVEDPTRPWPETGNRRNSGFSASPNHPRRQQFDRAEHWICPGTAHRRNRTQRSSHPGPIRRLCYFNSPSRRVAQSEMFVRSDKEV